MLSTTNDAASPLDARGCAARMVKWRSDGGQPVIQPVKQWPNDCQTTAKPGGGTRRRVDWRASRRAGEQARCSTNRLHNAARASRPASPLSSPTDCAGRSITSASTTDFDGLSSGAARGRAGELAGSDTAIICDPRAAVRQRSGASVWRWAGAHCEPAYLDNTVVYTLRATARQPASAGR
jgi:hypothetical protein